SVAVVNNVDYVVNLHQDSIAKKSSTITKIVDGNVIVIRE
ncbi:MAG TPA: translation factor Sua5, partial [Tenacibaculum sp.]|nr:translation factor Sua5 [Tenacibaculum sp.]